MDFVQVKEEYGSKLLFFAIFTIAGLIASRMNFSQLLGAPNQFFTLFQFFAPVAGGFLGSAPGAAVILATQLADFFIGGKQFTLLNIARLAPLVFAAWYFGSGKNRLSAIVPLAAIALFIAHPVGRQVWYFPLIFWSIPVALKLFFPEHLLSKSLGSTLAAHAVGGVVWIYTLPTTPAFWTGLIPIVAYERTLFATGIASSYVVLNSVLSRVKVPQFVNVDRKMPLAATGGLLTALD
ncbi:hypothetical protein HY995_05450 [Candidatus Micrarchaeota archaeon]|nr:hypothetical protein [Candidatus Micrarchaeota archaeon]